MTLSLLTAVVALSSGQVPTKWSCDAGRYADQLCDCGCGALDSDCPSPHFSVCQRYVCPAGEVPWEHDNMSCMPGTCGDGWKGENEACDDANALASGGCNASCSAVNAGYRCGERAAGCEVYDAGVALPDGGNNAPDAGGDVADAGMNKPHSGGCSVAPSSVLAGLFALVFMLLWQAGRPIAFRKR
jgi:cysteine-rich repeat protein